MSKQRLSAVRLSVNERGVVYDVNAGVDDPYSISLTLLSKPKVREDIEKNGIAAIKTTKSGFNSSQQEFKDYVYMIYLPEESPYFNLAAFIRAMGITYYGNIWPVILSLFDIIKTQNI